MADSITAEKRSWNMSRIHDRDTAIEVKVRRELFRRGYRYRKNVKDLPGKPDIVLPKYRTVIFVNGCFWHRHEGCKLATTPGTRAEFWLEKFEKNVANDQKHREQLEAEGWQVIVLWECEIEKNFDNTIEVLLKHLGRKQKLNRGLSYR